MSKFNQTATTKVNNYEGGINYINDNKIELASLVLNATMSSESFYETQNEKIDILKNLISLEQSDFIAKLAIFARCETNLRSVSHILIVLLAENNDKSGCLRKAVYGSIARVDDMTEIVSLWNSRHPNKMVPNSIRRAFRDILEEKRFDEYQLKKYEQKKKKVKLKDIIRIAKPSKNLELYKKVLDESLPKIDTIHTNISKDKSAKELFEEGLKTKKLGFMEVLKLSGKIFEGEFDYKLFLSWRSYIVNEYRIKNTKVLPFRYFQTYMALKNHPKSTLFKEVLQEAFLIATKNDDTIIDPNETIAIMIDDSGSMSSRSLGLNLFEHALLFTASIASKINPQNLKLYFWADRCEEFSFDTTKPFDLIINSRANYGATYVSKPFEILLRDGIKVDKAIIFTDCQMYSDDYYRSSESFKTYFDKYKQQVNSECKLLFWDLAGYGAGTPIKLSENIVEANGISSKMLEIIPHLWDEKDYLVKEIEKISL